MNSFTDLINSLGVAEDGISTVYPETFIADIGAAYESDMSIPAARIAVLEADLAAAQAEVLALKAHNYELMVTAPVTDEVADSADSADENEDPEDDDDNAGIDGLFTEKKDNN